MAEQGTRDENAAKTTGTEDKPDAGEKKPFKTAAEIVEEVKKKAAAKEAAEKAAAEKPVIAKPGVSKPAVEKPIPAKPAPARPVTEKSRGKVALSAVGSGVNRLRSYTATIVWLVAVLCAAVLALGALFTVLDQANENNEIVSWVLDRGHDLVGPFEDVFKLKTAKNTLLVNWGIAALAYLVVGKLLERIIRP